MNTDNSNNNNFEKTADMDDPSLSRKLKAKELAKSDELAEKVSEFLSDKGKCKNDRCGCKCKSDISDK